MASHAVALSISAFAYIYARRHAHDKRYSFGTGKVNTLGGYTGAVLLAGFAVAMAAESIDRFIQPVDIEFNQAIFVAVLGLIVNGASVLILGHHHHPEDAQDLETDIAEHAHYHEHHHDHDHNLISAYLHVLADALTSLLAIFALLAAKYFDFIWADPLMGIVGAVLVAHWSMGLLHSTSVVLLDRQGPNDMSELIRHRIENDGANQVVDLHLWAIGPKMYSVEIALVADDPRPPDYYKDLIPEGLGIVHAVVEVHAAD